MTLLPNAADVILVVSDIDRSIPFYRDGLGLLLINDRILPVEVMEGLTQVKEPEIRVAVFVHPEAAGACGTIQLIEWQTNQGKTKFDGKINDTGSIAVCLHTSDLDQMVVELEQKGIDLYGPVVDWTFPDGRRMKEIYIRDPDGITIALIEFLNPEEAGSHGGFQVTTEGHGSDNVLEEGI